MAFALHGGLSFCITEDRLVFLDLPSDRYFCLSPAMEADFRKRIEAPTDDNASIPLHAWNLSVPGARLDGITECNAPAVTSALSGNNESSTARGGLIAISWILRSRMQLKLRGLAGTIAHLAHRKACLREDRASTDTEVRFDRTLSHVAGSFETASALIDTHGRCLVWSLAIAHRLLSLEIKPLLVLGVRLTPFAAHAWVQVGGTLINERPERTDRFTPILIV